MALETLVLSLHVVANLFWIGSIVAVGLLVSAPKPDLPVRGGLARLIYRRIAAPAFAVSFVTALLRLALSPSYYFVATHFMHAKILLGLGVIGLHHVLGARARRAERGEASAMGGVPALTAALAVLAAGTAWLAIAKPF
ncbi:MAG TPA: CopD family protein [Polyangiaceae bacterium]|nr:CopD family protein [Polyangiaceae bacterium]